MNKEIPNIKGLIVLLFSTTLFFACTQQQQSDASTPLAKVGTEVLSLQDAREAIPDYLLEQDSVAAIKNYRKNWVDRKIMVQEARRLGIDAKKSVQHKINQLKEDVLSEALKNQILQKLGEKRENVTRQDARNYYQKNKKQFLLSERYVRFRHMITETLQKSRQAKADLMAGKKWTEVARTYSVDSKKAIEHAMKFYPVSIALPEQNPMSTYIDLIGVTEISAIRRFKGQYHFIQLVEERAEGEHPNLDWLLERIEEWIKVKNRKDYINSYVRNLYLKAETNNEVKLFDVFTESQTAQSKIDSLQQGN